MDGTADAGMDPGTQMPHFVLSFPLSPNPKVLAKRGHGVGHKPALLCQRGAGWGALVSPLGPWKVTQGITLEDICSGGSSWLLLQHMSSKPQQLHPHHVFYLLVGKHNLIKIPCICFQVNNQDQSQIPPGDQSQTPPAAGGKHRAAPGWTPHWEAEWNNWEFTTMFSFQDLKDCAEGEIPPGFGACGKRRFPKPPGLFPFI